jgi:hypothetical protein
MCSTDLPSVRASVMHCSSSADEITPSATRPSNLVALRLEASAARCMRWRIAVARVLHSCATPSTSSAPKAWSLLLLMICSTPCKHVAVQDGGHQHLPGAVPGALVDLLEEGERRVDLLERLVVVDIGQVELLPAEGAIAGQALRRNGQLQVAAAVEAGFDLGDDRGAVFVDRVQGQAVGIEQLADVLAGLQHDLVEVLGIVDARRDIVQLLVEQRLEGNARASRAAASGSRRRPVQGLSGTAGFRTAFIGRTPARHAASGCHG